MKTVFTLVFIIFISTSAIFSQTNCPEVKKPVSLSKTAIFDTTTWIDVNNIRMVTTNRGSIAFDLVANKAGLEYPAGSGKPGIFAAGILLCGEVDYYWDLRGAIAQYYNFEYYPGNITSAPGTRQVTWADGDDPKWKVLKLNKGDGPENPDYTLWKEMARYGAPVDEAGNPLITGDQMLWTIFNDADLVRHNCGTGSTLPLNIEVQESIFAWDYPLLEDVVFLKFKLINKGPDIINNFYASFWSDPDLGFAAFNDLTGCDPDLGLAYVYDADTVLSDESREMENAAGGIAILQGLKDDNGKALSMTSFNEHI